MAIRIVRLGEPRARGEGLRIGTVRKPPRGVPKERFAKDDWYDVWYPDLSPSDEAFEMARSAKTDKEWAAFKKRFHKEMNEPRARRTLDLLAALSREANFAVGCYCEKEEHCHRSVLRELFEERGTEVR
jgi:uncharacterized protein YeaO (DUF488 family)